MTDVKWTIQAREFGNCNCAYGCPCQFNARPTYDNCHGLLSLQIDRGFHGSTQLDGLNVVCIFTWPGAVHEGKGTFQPIIDRRATPAQRDALLRIVTGLDTEPGATVFQVFSTTMDAIHKPIHADIDFNIDIDGRTALLSVDGLVEARGEPIRNPVTGDETRAQINLPNGFEFTTAEIGRGWTTTQDSIRLKLTDSHGYFAHLHLSQSGVVR